ncbi:MAG: ankyrin repeat domain-containing protein [Fibrella sp.]|nr:ankyrin repeat domain-containing protein [Armatimonadota bacterium]
MKPPTSVVVRTLIRWFRAGLFLVFIYNVFTRSHLGRDSPCDAAYYGRCWEIRLLLASGADPSRVGWEDHFTPLGQAVRGGHLEAARLLLQYGADPNVPNDSGNTAIHAWEWNAQLPNDSQYRVIALLKKHGAH